MNKERLFDFVEFMAYLADGCLGTWTRDEIKEAEEELKKLIKRDVQKNPIFGTNKITQSIGFFCPNCNQGINKREHLYFCKCGQRLKWGE